MRYSIYILAVFFIPMMACKGKSYYEMAMYERSAGRLDMALIFLDLALEEDRTCEACWLERARIRTELGQFEEALEDYLSIRQNTRYSEGYIIIDDEWDRMLDYELAQVYLRLGDMDHAFLCYSMSRPREELPPKDLYYIRYTPLSYSPALTPEDFYWYGQFFAVNNSNKDNYYAYYHLEQAAQAEYKDAYDLFMEYAGRLGRPQELLIEVATEPVEICFTDGSVLLPDAWLDHNSLPEEYELVSVEEKRLPFDYIFFEKWDYCYPHIMHLLVKQYGTEFVTRENYPVTTDWVEVAQHGKKIGFNLAKNLHRLRKGATDIKVLVFRFRIDGKEKNFLLGLEPVPYTDEDPWWWKW
ncbi:MAG: hypothetical protein LUG98_07195 [Tannerellaceae bacterium]|nr:hypothetical protein [Tannerellaceae bacterium]